VTGVATAPAEASTPFERAFERAANAPAIAGNRVEVLVDGPDTYDTMIAQIELATRRIHIEQYIFNDDACGSRFADALIARAAAGVRIRILYDWLGCLGTPNKFWRKLRRAGIDARPFGKPRLADPLFFISRDHRKVLIVDGMRAVTGGLCIGDEWTGDAKQCSGPWRDTAISIEGPGAQGLDAAFRRAWMFAGGDAPDDATEIDAQVASCGDTTVRVIATEPGRERAFRIIDLILAIAEEKIWLTEAYLVAPQRLYQAFKDAARDGVDVRMLLPGQSDLRVVRNLTRSGYRGLMGSGVRIWEWGGPMLHAKTIVADGRWVRVGSSNLNPSSLLANWELDVLIDDRAIAGTMESQFLTDIARSSEVVRRPRRIPVLFGRSVPPALARSNPEAGQPARHVPGVRERRRRAVIALSGLVSGARAAVFGPMAALLLLVAVLFVLFPGPMAWVAASLCGVFGSMALVRALGHRARG